DRELKRLGGVFIIFVQTPQKRHQECHLCCRMAIERWFWLGHKSPILPPLCRWPWSSRVAWQISQSHCFGDVVVAWGPPHPWRLSSEAEERGMFLGRVYPGWRAEALTPGYYLEPLSRGPPSGVLELAR